MGDGQQHGGLGAGQPERAEKSTWLAARYNLVFQSCIGIFLLTTAPFIADLFTNDPDVLRIGTDCLRILAIGAPAYAIGMIVTQAINGSGDTATPSSPPSPPNGTSATTAPIVSSTT